MIRYAFRRLLLAAAVAFTVSLAAFLTLHLATDPAQAIAGENATPDVVHQIRVEYGLDRPLTTQYGAWIDDLAHGDLGESYYWHQSVGHLIAQAAPVTFKLASLALLFTIGLAIPLGALAALRPNTWLDRLALSVAVAGQAVPTFWFALMAIVAFAVKLHWFPVAGGGSLAHFVLPAFVLSMRSVPPVMRLTRAGLLEAFESDYIRTARAKGFRGSRLLTRQALRNALLPVISVLAVQLGHKLGGSIIVESVFSLPGIGRLTLDSILGGDIPTVQMLVFVFALIFVGLTFVADLINAWLDPRLRLG
ncbi:ABC transporter permease [Salinisphaera hydrothermalis]|uniref:Permease protein, ABC-type oligopeptide transporter n=1 Tax=Salinisphaera hydrothermalis (strain C41B8) TaxID=1304275 RepID=A0A084IG82_SALHC|nr:ABC transporter permease [Salinisphaera hydrothermalis]KEZ75716.1 permease protein, ABC-type oligopeptide transporter [Salinisphaera hydrothermalis C41B8]